MISFCTSYNCCYGKRGYLFGWLFSYLRITSVLHNIHYAKSLVYIKFEWSVGHCNKKYSSYATTSAMCCVSFKQFFDIASFLSEVDTSFNGFFTTSYNLFAGVECNFLSHHAQQSFQNSSHPFGKFTGITHDH